MTAARMTNDASLPVGASEPTAAAFITTGGRDDGSLPPSLPLSFAGDGSSLLARTDGRTDGRTRRPEGEREIGERSKEGRERANDVKTATTVKQWLIAQRMRHRSLK